MYASLSHTHYWYEVGMLKVLAIYGTGQDRKQLCRFVCVRTCLCLTGPMVLK